MGARKRSIKIRRFFPYSPDIVWQAIATKEALSQWLMKTDFEPVVGKRFQFRAEPMPGWRGYVDCEVLEVVENQRLVYSWQGMPDHSITTVTYELQATEKGTVLVGIHDGFDASHGWLSGLMLRAMLKAGWRKMYKRLLPQVLHQIQNGRQLDIVNDVNCYQADKVK